MLTEYVNDLYHAKCKDTGERPRKEEGTHFKRILLLRCKKSNFEMRESRLGPSSAAAIAKILKNTPQFTKLDLYGNSIRDAGVISLVELLKFPQCAITELNLGCNEIWEEGGKALGEALKQNKSLQTLELGASNFFWHDNSLGQEAAVAIAEGLEQNVSLQYLGIGRNVIGQNGIRGCEAFAKMLKLNRNLSTLVLSHNFLSTRGAILIVESLGVNNYLHTLDLSENALGPELGMAVATIMQVSNNLLNIILSKNKLGSRGVSAIGDALKVNDKLQVLKLEDNSMGDWGAASLAEALQINKSLTVLDVASNEIGVNGALSLAKSLASHLNMVNLNMSENNMGNEIAISIAESLKHPECALISLGLNSTKLSYDGGVAIASSLEMNKNLLNLRMKDNFLSEKAGAEMADCFGKNVKIINVELTGNQLNHSTIKKIKKITERNKNMKKNQEVAPLKEEIIRLKSQKAKLPGKELLLGQQIEALEHAQRHLKDADEQLVQLKSDVKTELKFLHKKLQETLSQVKEDGSKLGDREADLKKMTEELDFKIAEVNQSLAQEQKIKEDLEKQLEGLSNEVNVKQHEQKVEEVRKEIEKVREDSLKLKEKETDLRDELETLQEEESTWKKKKSALSKGDKEKAKKKKKPKKRPSGVNEGDSEVFEDEDGTMSKSVSRANPSQSLSRTATMPPINGSRASTADTNKIV